MKPDSLSDCCRCLAFLSILALCIGSAPCRALAADKWQVLETRYVTLWHPDAEVLARFNKNIRYSPDGSSFSSFFSSKPKDFNATLVRKMEALFEKVQQILDMRKPMKKIRIRIYPDRDALMDAYQTLYKQKTNIRAWYIFEFNTIYLNAQDVTEGMLAHEMAHAVIDNYMDVRPPRNTAEILARYVDGHLFDEVKQY